MRGDAIEFWLFIDRIVNRNGSDQPNARVAEKSRAPVGLMMFAHTRNQGSSATATETFADRPMQRDPRDSLADSLIPGV